MIEVTRQQAGAARLLAGTTAGLVLAALAAVPSSAADGVAPTVTDASVASRALVLGATGTSGTAVTAAISDADGVGSVTLRFLDPAGVARRTGTLTLASGTTVAGRWVASPLSLPVSVPTGTWRVTLTACDTAAACVDADLGAVNVRRAATWTEIGASVRRVVKGKRTKVRGRLLGMTASGTNAALADRTVALQFRRSTSASWAHVRSLRTSGRGRIELSVTPKATGWWRIVYAGSATHQPRTGAAVAVDVSPVKSWTFGRSVRGRALTVHRIGDPNAARRVLVVGSVHGNERAGLKVVDRLRSLAPPKGVVYFLVPNLNPDGAKANTRQNARGVDLNRNFPRRWKQSGSKWDTYYPGPRRSSEPEVRAAQRLIRAVSPTTSIWYHQHMNLVDPAAGPRATAKAYGRATGMTVTKLVPYRGSASTWQGWRWPSRAAFIVELPRSVSAAKVTRHAKAVRTVSVLPKG